MDAGTESTPGRREELIDHALDIVRESGLASLTMKKVARRVGFTETAAYRYFPDKQALLRGLAGRIRESLLGPVRQLAASPDPAGVRLRRILQFHIDYVVDLDGLPFLLLVEAASGGDDDTLRDIRAIVREYMRLLEEVAKELEPGDPEIASSDIAALLMGIPTVVAMRRRLRGDRRADRRARDRLVPFVVDRLLAASPEAAD